MVFKSKFTKYHFAIFFILSLSGCSTWDNFTTYFNLYYNTATLFDDTEAEILNQKHDLFSNEPLVVQGNSKNALIKVIEKSSKLLQFNASSGFVDEALMMLGKAFYYQGNFQKAKRKFEEQLATKPDDEKEILQANLWIAKCSFALKENTEALKITGEVRAKAVEEGYDDLIRESYIEEIKYQMREEKYVIAISLANEFADVYNDDVTRAQIYYELGKLYTLTGDKENAIAAYEKVFNYSPDFDLEISATIEYANSLREAGQNEKALEVFENIRNKDKFQSSFNQIDFEIGKTLVQLGKYNEAYDQFRLVDSTYKNTPFASAANFELGELYRAHLSNYDSAGYFYTRAATTNPPKDYLEKAKTNNQLFIKYAKLRKDINKFNRQLFYSENPDIFAKDSAAYTQDSLKILADYLEKKELQDIWNNVDISAPKTDSTKLLDLTILKHSKSVKDSLNKVDSLIRIGLYNPLDTIGLRQSIQKSLVEKFVKDSLNKVDSLIRVGMFNSRDTVGLKQKLFNEYKLRNIANSTNIMNKDIPKIPNQNLVKLDSVKFKRNPPLKLKIPIDSAKTVLAKNSLELGNLFLAELNVPDSAYYLYSTILKNYPSKKYYPTTLYALGSYHLTINQKEKADSLFKIIYDNYKDQSIVNAAANKLNLPLVDLKFDPAKDQYASAEGLMLEGNYDQSLNKFFSIYKDYPKSPIAPQALYTSGWILENNLSLPDSAAAMYDILSAKYPTSIYVKQVTKKLTTYKQEKARIQKAIQDSLIALQKMKTDSVLVENKVQVIEKDSLVDKTLVSEEPDEKRPNEKVNVVNKVNGLNQKKLEPLWDPRKHFN